MKYKLLIILCLVGLHSVFAQTRLAGRVTNKNREPLASATVQILNADDRSIIDVQETAADGSFIFGHVKPGKFLLVITMTGFNELSFAFDVGRDTLVRVPDIILSENAVALQGVQVTGRKKAVEIQADRNVLNVQSSATAAGSSVLTAISTAPNVEVDRSNNQIALNGRQGVTVMINGKELRMDAAAVIQYLDGLPAAGIRKIEFIHTPSSSMDASGTAGVINIWLLKNENEGSNGMVTAAVGYGIGSKYNLAFNYNYNKDKLSLSADFSSTNNQTERDLQEITSSFSKNQTTQTNLFSKRPVYIGLHNGRIGLDYALSKNTSLNFLAAGYISDWEMHASTQTVSTTGSDYNLSRLLSVESNKWTHYMGSLGIRHHFSERSNLNFNIDYLNYRDNNPTRYENFDSDADGNVRAHTSFTSRKETPIHFLVMQLDYTRILKKDLSLEAGVKLTRSSFINDVGVSDLVNGEPVENPVYTSRLILDESIQAVYLSSDFKIGSSITGKAGVRYEYDNNQLDSAGNKNLIDQKYGKLFPSVSLTRRFANNRQLMFSYDERIARPSFNAIAPAFFFFGPNNIVTGTPGLLATTSRQASVSYQIPHFTFTLQYSRDKNPELFQTLVDTVRNLNYIRWENMPSQDLGMFSINHNSSINKWSNQTTVSLFYERITPVYNQIMEIRNDFYVAFNTTQGYKFSPTFSFELNGQFKTQHHYGFGEMPFLATFNSALVKTIGAHHRISLNWFDMFNWGNTYSTDINQPRLNMVYRFNYISEGSILKLTYVYRFGNTKLKQIDTRQNTSSDEMKRVN